MIGQRRISEAELHAFVDGELAPVEQAEIGSLLAEAPAERALVHELGALNEAIKSLYADRLAAPTPASIEAPLDRFARGGPGLLRPSARLAAAVLLVLGAAAAAYGVRLFRTAPSEPEIAFVETALGAHSLYVPEVRHPVEVKAEEAHLVRWLAKRVGADVRAPALAGAGWILMGGRLLPDHDGLPAAQFMYEDARGRRLTLYVHKETGRGDTAFRFFERDGFGAFYWIDRPLAYALAGRLARNELLALANAAHGQLEHPPGRRAPGAQ